MPWCKPFAYRLERTTRTGAHGTTFDWTGGSTTRSGTDQNARGHRTHNPEVVGSNPTRATSEAAGRRRAALPHLVSPRGVGRPSSGVLGDPIGRLDQQVGRLSVLPDPREPEESHFSGCVHGTSPSPSLCKPFANGLQRTPWTETHSMDFPPYRSELHGLQRTGKHGAIGLITQRS